LGLLTGFDALFAVFGAFYAGTTLASASPIHTWQLHAWLFAAALVTLPVASVMCPTIAWMKKDWPGSTRLVWAVCPAIYAIVLSIVIEGIRHA
jgi:hypothetical protein